MVSENLFFYFFTSTWIAFKIWVDNGPLQCHWWCFIWIGTQQISCPFRCSTFFSLSLPLFCQGRYFARFDVERKPSLCLLNRRMVIHTQLLLHHDVFPNYFLSLLLLLSPPPILPPSPAPARPHCVPSIEAAFTFCFGFWCRSPA